MSVCASSFVESYISGNFSSPVLGKIPPHMNTRITYADSVHQDELIEEFDTFPTPRSSDLVRMSFGPSFVMKFLPEMTLKLDLLQPLAQGSGSGKIDLHSKARTRQTARTEQEQGKITTRTEQETLKYSSKQIAVFVSHMLCTCYVCMCFIICGVLQKWKFQLTVHQDELIEEFDTFPTLRSSDLVRMRYCAKYYSVDNYKITYAEGMIPLEGPDDWEEPRVTIVPPLLIRKQGRPRKNRRKAYDETMRRNQGVAANANNLDITKQHAVVVQLALTQRKKGLDWK
ncbi:hypothetical protein POM88_054924 [Heracleum sosnowskyi]|uniref:Multiple C2 domain-containing protein n=1 Tax=Heracleum sosnowskyi TaxID=360622 RepID=A0AAD8GMT5_9APIA|nr:hypothetical protein POM88_054924 [Heracleum sosnowskyi]